MTKRRAIGSFAIAAALLLTGVAYAAYYDGTNGDDIIIVERSSAHAYLKAGNDRFEGARGDAGGADYVRAGSGNDTILTFTRPDILRGGRGNDVLSAGTHKDKMFGGPGNDIIRGGPNVDQFNAGTGHDICFGQRKDVNFPGSCEDDRILPP